MSQVPTVSVAEAALMMILMLAPVSIPVPCYAQQCANNQSMVEDALMMILMLPPFPLSCSSMCQ